MSVCIRQCTVSLNMYVVFVLLTEIRRLYQWLCDGDIVVVNGCLIEFYRRFIFSISRFDAFRLTLRD